MENGKKAGLRPHVYNRDNMRSRPIGFVGTWKSREQRKKEREELQRAHRPPPSPSDSMAARMNNYWM